VFRIGRILGHAARLPEGASLRWPYRQVTERDVWVDDPNSPFYNRHLILGEEDGTEGYDVHRMSLGDRAYRWLVLIEHNYENPVPYAGSAIFFHVRRGVQRASAGCTVMALEDLERFICWLRPEGQPVLVQLPVANYRKVQVQWGLPRLRDLPSRPTGFWPEVELGDLRDLHMYSKGR
jgi:L,D-peptidoglycan transpeptidase YkuD (ErfK/YbiS/YcfS/YnhG family)